MIAEWDWTVNSNLMCCIFNVHLYMTVLLALPNSSVHLYPITCFFLFCKRKYYATQIFECILNCQGEERGGFSLNELISVNRKI